MPYPWAAREKVRFMVRRNILLGSLARIFHELTSRNSEDALATGQPQELGPEA
jgi:hypothetical protein